MSTSALWSMEIVPLPTKNWVEMMGVSTVFGGNDRRWIVSTIHNQFMGEYNKENDKAIRSLIYPDEEKEEAQKNFEANKVTRYAAWLNNLNVEWEWRNMPITITGSDGQEEQITFNSVSDAEKEKLVNAINTLDDDDKRKKFGEVWNITIWSNTRIFDKTESKYKSQSQNNTSNTSTT